MCALANNAGANFMLPGPKKTMVKNTKPVISVCATHAGCGKSQTSCEIVQYLMTKGLIVVAIRYPMPSGNQVEQEGLEEQQKLNFSPL
jgi:predicted GTPase